MEVFTQEPCARSFELDVELHLMFGFVFATPDFFIMGRPVDSAGRHEDIVNPSFEFPKDKCDCWMVYLMAGDVTKVWNIMPYPLPKVCFERRNELRFYSLDSIRRIQTNPIP